MRIAHGILDAYYADEMLEGTLAIRKGCGRSDNTQ